ncbi:MAG: TIGR02391 family protein [Balneolaceae bacterium]
MNIKELIDERLWKEIKRNYLNEQYSNAVLDGIQFIGDLIREMSGEDGDGYNLIGQVFNTKNPKIKVNRFRTQTEKNVQDGIRLLLQGFYRAIRNERVHEKKTDSEQEAYELLLFLNHILRIIDKSKGKFTIENTLRRVFDENFLPREEYAEHIIKEIPPTKKYEVAVEVFRSRKKSNRMSDLSVFWNQLLSDLKQKETGDLRNEISNALRYSEEAMDVTTIVFLVGNDWKNLDHDARLRAENLLIRSLPTFLSDDPMDGPQAFQYAGISNAVKQLYVRDFMELKEEFAEKIYTLFKKTSGVLTEYVISVFGNLLKELEKFTISDSLDVLIREKLKSGNRQLITFLDQYYPADKASELKLHLPVDDVDPFDDMDDDLPF